MGFIREGTSKGNQSKFIKDDWFYKDGSSGYQSISEALVSEFLSFVEGVDYIDYYLELVEKYVKSVECCKSKVYNTDNENFISVGKILKVYTNKKNLSLDYRLGGIRYSDYVKLQSIISNKVVILYPIKKPQKRQVQKI